MKKTRGSSRLEIWDKHYVNCPDIRDPMDKDVILLQVESIGDRDLFLVEVIDGEKVQSFD